MKCERCTSTDGFGGFGGERCEFRWQKMNLLHFLFWIYEQQKRKLTGISSCDKLAWVPISSSSCLILSTDCCWFAGELRRLSSTSWFSFGKGLNLKLLCEDAWILNKRHTERQRNRKWKNIQFEIRKRKKRKTRTVELMR